MNDLFLLTKAGRVLPERLDTQMIMELMLRDVLESEDKEKTLLAFFECCRDIKTHLESRELLLL